METRIPPLVWVVIAVAATELLYRFMPLLSLRGPYTPWLAGALALAGLGVMIGGALTFRLRGTTVTPLHPEQASKLVVSGVFHLTRNPMYLGMLLLIAGFVVFRGAVSALIVLPLFILIMNRWQICPEERALLNIFGEDYANYCKNVRRWI